MHRIPKKPSPIYPQQSVSSAEEAPFSSGSKRRAGGLSLLVLSPLTDKRRRGDAGEAKKNHLGSFNKARFDEADARIDNHYMQNGIKTGEDSSEDDSNNRFAEEFEATNTLYGQDGVLESDFFPLEMLCNSESQELEERGENQSDSAEDSLTNLFAAYTNDSLADEDCEMSLEEEIEANHAMPSFGVWDVPLGQKSRKFNQMAIQNFILKKSPDLTMTTDALRDAFRDEFKNELLEKTCPSRNVFKRNRQELEKLKKIQGLSNQPKPLRRYLKVSHMAIQDFILKQSPDLQISEEVLRDTFKEAYGDKLCPSRIIFSTNLKNLRAERGKKNPALSDRPKSWFAMKINHDVLQGFIKITSPDLSMGAMRLRNAYIKAYGKKSCPSLSAFNRELRELKDKSLSKL